MITRNDTSSGVNLLPVLAALIVLCLGGAALLTLLTQGAGSATAPAEQSLVVQRISYEAQNALRGESTAFDALNKSVARLKALHSAAPDKGAGSAAAWNKLSDGVKAVGDARTAVQAIQASNQETR